MQRLQHSRTLMAKCLAESCVDFSERYAKVKLRRVRARTAPVVASSLLAVVVAAQEQDVAEAAMAFSSSIDAPCADAFGDAPMDSVSYGEEPGGVAPHRMHSADGALDATPYVEACSEEGSFLLALVSRLADLVLMERRLLSWPSSGFVSGAPRISWLVNQAKYLLRALRCVSAVPPLHRHCGCAAAAPPLWLCSSAVTLCGARFVVGQCPPARRFPRRRQCFDATDGDVGVAALLCRDRRAVHPSPSHSVVAEALCGAADDVAPGERAPCGRASHVVACRSPCTVLLWWLAARTHLPVVVHRGHGPHEQATARARHAHLAVHS
jgi:hypothetical protein